ncbi:aminomethyl-transferring glycine dehydrogenase subunit GcvPB [Promethearchaeum syntrophicum]|uniref:glycine dehydrogenase (aminomethyl-transferring) n=1 Tax=Promethearchaeum syntrophicum TaxID=2594042 RepID=A0A5B9D6E7_9ARCH|nr:aminomethyl-transferring glycine dehydrogenase subunit GcvPB [Candidatus Prometheoarchaeum syntrophicum]QEE14664.1 glycine dehydrogenase subunit 2 [Candidatus Prometheoarchaeum syntrophicum]
MTRELLIFEKGYNTAKNNFIPKMDIKGIDLDEILPKSLQRSEEINLPDIPEFEIVRHYVNLAQKNYGVDSGIYPLGSCTMKYNPRINEITARLPGFLKIHPLQEENEGAIELIYNLGQQLCEICGMKAFTLNPAAGAQGELTGILIIKKYFESKGIKKDKIIVPDSAHGTNPATSAMAGFSIIEIKSDENGELPLDQLEFAMKGGDVAGLMLTNPNTIGVFDRNIDKITEIVHKYGGLCYYDGANLNPIMGIAKPGEMGFDIIHLNLHKTFSTPHGGGGPGAGPVGVKKDLIKYLPCPQVIKNEGGLVCVEDDGSSIGRMRSFWGNFGVLVRAYTYILALGKNGIRRAAQNAVLNANYIRTQIKHKYSIPYDRINMHEFLVDVHLPNGVNSEDVAKGLLDRGIHAPTIYFPLIIHEAMLIEPTETENKRELDKFIKALLDIYEEAENNPDHLRNGPYNTLIGRLDATLAARKPHLRD